MEAHHILELEMGGAPDQAVLDQARRRGAVVVTMEAGFHRMLVESGEIGPSVIRIRIERLSGEQLAGVLLDAVKRTEQESNPALS